MIVHQLDVPMGATDWYSNQTPGSSAFLAGLNRLSCNRRKFVKVFTGGSRCTYADFGVLFEIGPGHHPSPIGLKKVHCVLFDYGLGYPPPILTKKVRKSVVFATKKHLLGHFDQNMLHSLIN